MISDLAYKQTDAEEDWQTDTLQQASTAAAFLHTLYQCDFR